MNAQAVSSNPTWLNPAVLKWAREWRGRSIDEAAKHLHKEPRQILDWESGNSTPTVKQARKLLQFYNRPFLELFLPSIPHVRGPVAIPDFRSHQNTELVANDWDLQETLRWAESRRLNALDLYEDLGEVPPAVPEHLFTSRQEDPEEVASRCRSSLGFAMQTQIELTKRDAQSLPMMLRKRLESIGVLTLRTPARKALKFRGICLATFPLPVIIVSNEASTAQAFTLMHEFAHVLLKESGITGERSREYGTIPIERWCDRFAAAFLMPSGHMSSIVGATPSRPATSITDSELARLAETFRVSPHAMLIRLVQLRYVDDQFYWGVKKPQFEREEATRASFGRSSYYGSRYRGTHGDLYTSLVLDAWAENRITNHGAAEYLGIKNFVHLNDIRDHFTAS